MIGKIIASIFGTVMMIIFALLLTQNIEELHLVVIIYFTGIASGVLVKTSMWVLTKILKKVIMKADRGGERNESN